MLYKKVKTIWIITKIESNLYHLKSVDGYAPKVYTWEQMKSYFAKVKENVQTARTQGDCLHRTSYVAGK